MFSVTFSVESNAVKATLSRNVSETGTSPTATFTATATVNGKTCTFKKSETIGSNIVSSTMKISNVPPDTTFSLKLVLSGSESSTTSASKTTSGWGYLLSGWYTSDIEITGQTESMLKFKMPGNKPSSANCLYCKYTYTNKNNVAEQTIYNGDGVISTSTTITLSNLNKNEKVDMTVYPAYKFTDSNNNTFVKYDTSSYKNSIGYTLKSPITAISVSENSDSIVIQLPKLNHALHDSYTVQWSTDGSNWSDDSKKVINSEKGTLISQGGDVDITITGDSSTTLQEKTYYYFRYKYYYDVYNNSGWSTSITKIKTKAKAIIYIYDGSWKECTPYVYVNGGWKECTAYLYNDGWKSS